MTIPDVVGRYTVDAIDMLTAHAQSHEGSLYPSAARFVVRARQHLHDSLQLETRPVLETEQQAQAFVKAVAVDLERAGQALHDAAARLKLKGDGLGANQARQAGTVALTQAQGLLG